MPLPPAPAPFTDADYEMIAAAVLETARGRWFLGEHARRNRHADTRLVLQAIERLERLIAQRASGPEPERLRLDLVEMMDTISRTKAEIAAIKPPRESTSHIREVSSELDAIVDTTEKATSDILAAAERIQEIAWTMREQGIDPSVCDLIDANASEIYTACSFQDLTGQRVGKVIEVLRFLEARIDAMIKILRFDDLEFVPANEAPAAPAKGLARAEGLPQHAVDTLMAAYGRQDVVWREARGEQGRDPRNLGEFDLDDLEVFDASPDTPLAVLPEPAPHSKHAIATPGGGAAKVGGASGTSTAGDGIGALTPASRLALFS